MSSNGNENSPTTYGDNEFKEMNQGVEIRLFIRLIFLKMPMIVKLL
ncbi:DUF806 family protein [Oenococcus oeni]|nr:DUF806 family protein [Oenococcus oeni]